MSDEKRKFEFHISANGDPNQPDGHIDIQVWGGVADEEIVTKLANRICAMLFEMQQLAEEEEQSPAEMDWPKDLEEIG